jgi:hypothetical protein
MNRTDFLEQAISETLSRNAAAAQKRQPARVGHRDNEAIACSRDKRARYAASPSWFWARRNGVFVAVSNRYRGGRET